METIIEINNQACLTEHHPVLTKRGLVEAGMLKRGDEVIGVQGIGVITKICKFKPKKRK